jgi:zinc protease
MSPNPKLQRTKTIVLVACFVLIPLILLLLTLTLRPAAAVTPKHYTDLSLPPAPTVQIPESSRFQLANGMTVYLMENHELPLVGGTALIRTGSRLEPGDEVGLASLTGIVMRSGGTETRSADALNEFLEQRAAAIETAIDQVSGSASFSALTEDLDAVFAQFADVIRHPAFPEDKLKLAKTQLQGNIARRNDDPNSIVGREFRKLIYGATNPYGRTVEYTTLDNISRDDVLRFYQQSVQPQNLLLGIVGDFDRTAMRRQIEAQFGDWRPQEQSMPRALPAVAQAQPSGIFLVNQPQLTQSSIQIGHLGGQADSPDYPALMVMNEVLNGFGGRLFNEVRSRQGLAYSVYGQWSPQFDYPGLFVAGGQTRSDATVPFIKSVLAELEQIRSAPVSAAELAFAKDSVLNSFIFNFQSPAQTLSRLLRYEYFGYPDDFIFRYQAGVAATTIADVQRVAATYLRPSNLVTLVVGNAAAIQPPLTSLNAGTVTAIDVTIAPPQS